MRKNSDTAIERYLNYFKWKGIKKFSVSLVLLPQCQDQEMKLLLYFASGRYIASLYFPNKTETLISILYLLYFET